jgi:predicted MFS family arabinose efflux permease
MLERRRLTTGLLLAAAAVAAACAAATAFPVLAAALAGLGALAVVAQVVVPLSAALAGPQERGQVVGTVMSGLLIGILFARTLSGVLAAIGGWRLPFGLAAGVMVALAVVMWRALPTLPPTERVPYRSALASVLALVASEPVLRLRMVLGALGFACFSILWTSVAFLLGGPPYGYSAGVIGLFGLVGVTGALVAPFAGRFADRGYGRLVTTVFLAVLLGSWGLLALGGHILVALIAGIVLLDFGVQGAHVSNQSAIYELAPEARSRLTTAYMVSMFLGGVVGSLLSAAVWDSEGWGAVCVLGAAFAAAALLTWAVTQRLGVAVSPGAVTVVSPRPNAAAGGGPVGQVDARGVRRGERQVENAEDGEHDARAAAMVERQVVRGDS